MITTHSLGVGFTDGITSRNATFYLKKGKRYEFENDIGAHPFYIKTFETFGITGTTGRYDNGVTNNGATSGIIAFDVPFNAPDKLSYQCSAHAAMGGTIFLTGGDASTLVDFDAGQINVTGVSTFNSDLSTKQQVFLLEPQSIRLVAKVSLQNN